MSTKFKTFRPGFTTFCGGKVPVSAAENLTEWLEKHPEIEIISWQTTPIGQTNELYITIQCKEKDNGCETDA